MEQLTLEFVNGYTEDSKEKRRLDRLARTHAAKVGSSRSLQRRKTSQSAALPVVDKQSRARPMSQHVMLPIRTPRLPTPSRPGHQREGEDDNASHEPPLTWTLSPVFGAQGFANAGTATGIQGRETMNYCKFKLASHLISHSQKASRSTICRTQDYVDGL